MPCTVFVYVPWHDENGYDTLSLLPAFLSCLVCPAFSVHRRVLRSCPSSLDFSPHLSCLSRDIDSENVWMLFVVACFYNVTRKIKNSFWSSFSRPNSIENAYRKLPLTPKNFFFNHPRHVPFGAITCMLWVTDTRENGHMTDERNKKSFSAKSESGNKFKVAS